MYTVTFYSFKGGVGRTMALVNVAFEMAKQERTVLMVDFDLEAPGLDSFLEPHGSRPSRGLVDFVTDYRNTGHPPDITDYVYQVGSGSTPKVWFMPAGRRGKGYGARLHAIDWRKLYEEEDGYLLFEDLKAQWQSKFDPDYVFLDSRTGHTDVGGICTRQLPDAVTLLFRLDPQNLEGLARVSSDIRHELLGTRKKKIKMHFVPSNVPRLDDEDHVIADQIDLFKKRLDFKSTEVRIQHYEDIEMLRHSVYTVSRPNSRIAGEYIQLAKEIARYNSEDVEGARDYLRKVARSRRIESAESVESRISNIALKHRHDHEILKLLADIRQRQGKLSQAVSYLTEALDTGVTSSTYLLRRAELYQRLGQDEETKADVLRMLRTPIENFFEVSRLINIARQVDRSILEQLPNSKAFSSLDVAEKRVIANDLMTANDDFQIAIQILTDIVDDPTLDEADREKTISTLALPLIGVGAYGSVLEQLVSPTTVEDRFNLAMADWGESSSASTDLFVNVVATNEKTSSRSGDGANYDFCLAIAKCVTGDLEGAHEHIVVARQTARENVGNIFSPWTYRNVSSAEFLDDLENAEALIGSSDFMPAFVAEQIRKSS